MDHMKNSDNNFSAEDQCTGDITMTGKAERAWRDIMMDGNIHRALCKELGKTDDR